MPLFKHQFTLFNQRYYFVFPVICFCCVITAITCGDPTANSTDIQFLCSGDSYEFGSVCWARCKYGYILRNEQQEQQEEATLIEMVDQAFIKLNDAKVSLIHLEIITLLTYC